MGKIDAFSIGFQKPQPVYVGGETVVGVINIQVKERLKINSVSMTIQGSGDVHWYFFNPQEIFFP